MGLAGFRRSGGIDLVGPAFAFVGVLGFAFKAILIKLAYAPDRSLGPLFTIALGSSILGERVHWVQLAGAAAWLWFRCARQGADVAPAASSLCNRGRRRGGGVG